MSEAEIDEIRALIEQIDAVKAENEKLEEEIAVRMNYSWLAVVKMRAYDVCCRAPHMTAQSSSLHTSPLADELSSLAVFWQLGAFRMRTRR